MSAPLVTCKATGSGVNWPCASNCSPNCGPTAPDDPRTFALYRIDDETGVSGTGIVAQGVVFADGTAVMRWVSEHRSTAVYSSLDDLIAIHGHGGRTVVRWLPWHVEP